MEITSIILRVEDLKRSVTFWSEIVGLAITSEIPGFAFLDGGAVSLALTGTDSPVSDESLTEIVFESEKVRATYRAMAERGVPFATELRPVTSNEGRDLVAAHFRDPDGHFASLTGWVDSD